MYQPKPLDVVVVDGHFYNPLHVGIMWRGLDKGCHCLTVKDTAGGVWSPQTGGILNHQLSDYAGRTVTIHRFKGDIDTDRLLIWGQITQLACKGYDFIALMGFIAGLKSLENDETRWYCSEFPYWLFHGNGCPLTARDLSFIYPGFFRDSPLFQEVWSGTL